MRKLAIFLSIFLFISQAAAALEPVLIVLGPPGSGKGTFSQYLKENYGYNHLSAGDIVRKEIDKKTPIGLQIADTVKRGEYIDVKIMQGLIFQNIQECKAENRPFIIDGFGRTDHEMDFLYQLLQYLDLFPRAFVLFFEADDSICKERMSHRLLCSGCDHIYNTLSAASLIEGQCDICFNQLKKRMNDSPEVIDKKISDYRERIESSYKRSFDLFPHMRLQTNDDIGSCLEFYKYLIGKIVSFEGNADDFVNAFEAKESA